MPAKDDVVVSLHPDPLLFATFLNPNVEVVNNSTRAMSILIIPYMLLALNLVTNSIFYGIGRTKYMAYQSILTNGTVYVVAFTTYVTGLWVPTFDSILVLFSIGILVDSLLTVYYASTVLRLGRRYGKPMSAIA